MPRMLSYKEIRRVTLALFIYPEGVMIFPGFSIIIRQVLLIRMPKALCWIF
jgi:hypothetical protein